MSWCLLDFGPGNFYNATCLEPAKLSAPDIMSMLEGSFT